MESYQYIWERPRWSDFCWNDAKLLSLLGLCRLLQGKLLSKVSSLGLSLETQAHAEILSEEIVKTSAIEGEKLDPRSVRSSVARKLGLPSAGLPVDRRTDNLVAVMLDATQECDTPLTKERLYGWHAALFPTGFSGLHRIRTGEWRGSKPMRVVSGPIGKETVHYEAPPAERIDSEVRRFLEWWAQNTRIEGIVRAAIAHFWFVTIHPFEDGNGRIARVITDMALAQDDKEPFRYYSLSAQIMAERDAYYSVLEKSQKDTADITEWLAWFLGCFSRAITRSENLLAATFAKAAFWRAHAGAPLSDRQRKVVNRLLDAEPRGFEGGLTTRKYVSIAKVSRATAFRELSQLLDWGLIRRTPGKGRNASYALVEGASSHFPQ